VVAVWSQIGRDDSLTKALSTAVSLVSAPGAMSRLGPAIEVALSNIPRELLLASGVKSAAKSGRDKRKSGQGKGHAAAPGKGKGKGGAKTHGGGKTGTGSAPPAILAIEASW